MTSSIRKISELLNNINHTPSKSNFKLDAKIKTTERTNAVLTSLKSGVKTKIGIRKKP